MTFIMHIKIQSYIISHQKYDIRRQYILYKQHFIYQITTSIVPGDSRLNWVSSRVTCSNLLWQDSNPGTLDCLVAITKTYLTGIWRAMPKHSRCPLNALPHLYISLFKAHDLNQFDETCCRNWLHIQLTRSDGETCLLTRFGVETC